MHSVLKNKLHADARAALKIIATLSPSRAVEALVALLEATLAMHFWFDARAREQISCEITNFIFLAREKRKRITESFIFWRFLRIVQDLLRDGLVIPRREFAVGTFLEEDESPEELFSRLTLLPEEECLDTKELFGHKPHRPGVRHKAAERALILALREKHSLSGQRACPDKKEVSGHKMRQGMLFKEAA